jgi:hypothetical protein
MESPDAAAEDIGLPSRASSPGDWIVRHRLALVFLHLGLLQWIYWAVFSHPWLMLKYRLGPLYTLVPVLSGAAYVTGCILLLGRFRPVHRILLGLTLGAACLGLSYAFVIAAAILLFTLGVL